MKILTISDLHGRAVWKDIAFDDYDRVIFLGDYVDGYLYDDATIFSNLLNVIQLRRWRPGKIVLLIGNHDAQYLHFPQYRCSGFREKAQPSLTTLFKNNADLFQIAHQEHDYLFSHAGASSKWLTYFLEKSGNESINVTPAYNLAGLLNSSYQHSPSFRDLLFEVGPARGGNNAFGGPVWADRSETQTSWLSGFHQVVGHTPVSNFTTIGDQDGSITYTDVLQTKTAFYEVIIPD